MPKDHLRVATEADTPNTPKPPKSISDAARDGEKRELLVALRARIAKTVEDPKTPPRDLASLSRRLMEIANEIEAIDAAAGEGGIGEAGDIPDEPFSDEAL
jgi:hypothetical protein